MTERYTIKELADSKGASMPVRAALLALEARVLELEAVLTVFAQYAGDTWAREQAEDVLS
jgi:hypothetical protein